MINKAILVGRLGKDPELTHTPTGTAVCNFSVATEEKWKDKNTGTTTARTEWHNCVSFSKLAEICGAYLKKGSLVYLEGSINTEQWEKDGIIKYFTKIKVREMKMLDRPDRQEEKPTNSFNIPETTEDGDIPF